MSDIAIRADGLSKQYRIGGLQSGYRTLRESIMDGLAAPYRAIRRKGSGDGGDNTFWALNDVSFEVKAGEVIGVIGRNGAGKSTLLKVLSRITEPTTGYADVYGRVGSLLEVGTGFHGELTGRENIYLNGAILGMNRDDIARKFDSIVAFAEVEKFVDTPVKFYSSGMYLRLAFAVAAHLEPEILLVDEVLAVGDINFQKKCLGKMGDVARQGRTILFVSHNMAAVRSLCEKGLVLNDGAVTYQGDIARSIETYYKLLEESNSETASRAIPKDGFGFGPIVLNGGDSTTTGQGQPFDVSTTLHIGREVAGFSIICLLQDAYQRSIFHLREESSNFRSGAWEGAHRITLKFPALWLEPGVYGLFFKVLLWGQLSRARYLSDIFRLDIAGNSSGVNVLMSPGADWSLEPVETVSATGAEAGREN